VLCSLATDHQRKAWTPEEEAIWHELVIKCLDQHLVPMVRADGRIKGRHLLSHKNATVSCCGCVG
jgi:hypothetical protein